MVVPSAGDIVLVPFPFSDLSSAKVRPALCLAHAGGDDWILCQITSNPYGDRNAVAIASSDVAAGSLPLASFARPGKLFTASTSLMIRSVATLNAPVFQQVLDAVLKLLQPGTSP